MLLHGLQTLGKNPAMVVLENSSTSMCFTGCGLVLISNMMLTKPQVASVLLYVCGMLFIILSLSMFRVEKDIVSSQVSTIIKQHELRESQPDINEPCILASFAGVAIVLGSCLLYNINYDWIGLTMFALGWIATGFAASANTNALSSVSYERLVYTLSGVFAIVIGSLLFSECQLAIIAAFAGVLLFTFGNTMIVSSV